MLKIFAIYILMLFCFSFSTCNNVNNPNNSGNDTNGNYSTGTKIEIISPQQNTVVPSPAIVEGKMYNFLPETRIYVLVHPLRTSDWWVQPIPSVLKDGLWRTRVYFGTHDIGIGEEYELVAIAPIKPLREGDKLNEIPESIGRSEIITVKRGNN